MKKIILVLSVVFFSISLFANTDVDKLRNQALNGNTDSMVLLGDAYLDGDGIARDLKKAEYWYKKSAESGNEIGMNHLAFYYEDTENYDKAFYWYKKASEKGYSGAMYFLASCYEEGIGTAIDYEKAAYWYKKAYELGEAGCALGMSVLYLEGKGVEQSDSKAASWMLKELALNPDNRGTIENVALFFEKGIGVEQNQYVADLFNQAAAKLGAGEKQASRDLVAKAIKSANVDFDDGYSNLSASEMYDKANRYYRNKEYGEAAVWYQRGANKGDLKAMDMLGDCYYFGRGLAQDKETAKMWYKKAAKAGYAQAMFDLGFAYFKEGRYHEAVDWYGEASSKGHVEAHRHLGICYLLGEGTTCNPEFAFGLFKYAANNGNTDAMYNLANCFEKGEGVSRSTHKAELMRRAGEASKAGDKKTAQNLIDQAFGIYHDNNYSASRNNQRRSNSNSGNHRSGNSNMTAEQMFDKARTFISQKRITEGIEWLIKSSDAGSTNASYMLGSLLYLQEKEDPSLEIKSTLYFKRAAEGGNADAMYFLGKAYLYGSGVNKDMHESSAWMAKAIQGGSKLAIKFVEDLKKQQ